MPRSRDPRQHSQSVTEVRGLLDPLADPVRAPQMAAYLKGIAPFLGIPAPVRRRATSTWIRGCPAQGGALLDLADQLCSQPEREYQYVAIDLLDRHRRRIPDDALPRLTTMALVRPWWDTVDALASVIGRLALVHPGWDAAVGKHAHDERLWARRIALVFQVGRRDQVDLDLLFTVCDQNLLGSRYGDEFFMRKAIGWALRDAGRTYPEQVWGYVTANRSRMSGLSLREATRTLPPQG